MKLRVPITAVLCMAIMQVAAVDASNRYRSPRNPERKIRRSTELIVLHTTEAPSKSSLNKLSERGECHFCVTEEGTIYRIVDRDREAFHAGRSMWKGREDVDKFSIGIECVGYHDKEMSLIQLYAIRDLVKELKAMYHLTDDKVVCHSHVAYGAPNKWQKYRHRGRKRCGMLFAMPSVRRILELKTRPAVDTDTKAKRLVVGDPYLAKVLYGSVDTMRSAYAGVASRTAKPAARSGKGTTEGIISWLKASGGDAVKAALPDPAFKTLPANEAELRSRGYVLAGSVSKGRTASSIAGRRWNSSDTYYTIRNKVIPGNMIDARHIEVGMNIWLKKQ